MFCILFPDDTGNYINVIYPVLHMVSYSAVFLLDQSPMGYLHYTQSKLLLLASNATTSGKPRMLLCLKTSRKVRAEK